MLSGVTSNEPVLLERVAVETADQASECRKCNRACTAGKRVTETADQADDSRKCNRAFTASKRVTGTADQADESRKCNRACAASKTAVETGECRKRIYRQKESHRSC